MDIKVRVWDRHANKYITLLHYQEMGAIHVENDGTLALDTDYRFTINMMLVKNEFAPEMYTNLNDDNSREIYEGDIVKIEGRSSYDSDILWSKVALVSYDKSTLSFVFTLGDGFKGNTMQDLLALQQVRLYGENALHFTVLGNIHQNKELLDDAVSAWVANN